MMDIADSARRHGIPAEDMLHAVALLASLPIEGGVSMPRTREQIEQAVAEFEEWADNLDLDDPNVEIHDTSDLRAIGLALGAVASAEQDLAAAVAVARANGRSWARIGMVLGVSKQAAMRRFGEPAVPRQGG